MFPVCKATFCSVTAPTIQTWIFLTFYMILKTHALLPGGVEPLTKEEISQSSDIQAFLAMAEKRYNMMANSMYLYRLEEVSGTKQVVEGMKYRFSVSMVPTLCLKSEESLKSPTSSTCEVNNSMVKVSCTFSVWWRPFLSDPNKSTILTFDNC